MGCFGQFVTKMYMKETMDNTLFNKKNISDISLLIKELNPYTDISSLTITNTTLINIAVFIATQVVNSLLPSSNIFDYQHDVFNHDFFKESGNEVLISDITLDLDDNLETLQNHCIDKLQNIQTYLKEYCYNILQSKKNILSNISTTAVYNIYNNGDSLPMEYKGLYQKISQYFKINSKPDKKLNDTLKILMYPFNINGLNLYCDGIYSKNLLYNDAYGDFNILEFMINNIELMITNLINHCLISINQINLVRGANQQNQLPISEIESLQTVKLLSSEFDYTALLGKYDIKAIDGSIIKYYQAVQQWTDELMDKLDYYEKEKEAVIRDFNIISLQLSKKYEHNPNLTDEENELLEQRQRYFQKKFSLGMNEIKSKILSVKKQANDIEYRIDKINNGDSAITELAKLEKEERASFSFIAENTAKIIHNALLKIEYLETHHQFVMNAISIWANWTENYRVFKTTYKEDLKNSCVEDSIEEEIWTKWYADWQKLRYNIELTIQPLIERGLKNEFAVENKEKLTVPEQIIAELEVYKNNIDKFFLEERKGIYQKFAFQAGGDLQDKFETESSLYKYTYKFQAALQKIIFNCTKAEDRIYILNWASSLLDIQIDEILTFVADNDLQEISKTILEEFAKLKQKNYDVYLTDIEAYSKEMAEREKQYNSLIFKMRKDLDKDNKEVKV